MIKKNQRVAGLMDWNFFRSSEDGAACEYLIECYVKNFEGIPKTEVIS